MIRLPYRSAIATASLTFLTAASALADEAAPVVDSGDTAWVLTASALVLMMTLPGLALFYGGLVRAPPRSVASRSCRSGSPLLVRRRPHRRSTLATPPGCSPHPLSFS